MSNCKDFKPLGSTDRCMYEAERSSLHCLCAFHGRCKLFSLDTDSCDANSLYKFDIYEPPVLDPMFTNNTMFLIDIILDIVYKKEVEKLYRGFTLKDLKMIYLEVTEYCPIGINTHTFKISDFVSFSHISNLVGADEYKCTFIGEVI